MIDQSSQKTLLQDKKTIGQINSSWQNSSISTVYPSSEN